GQRARHAGAPRAPPGAGGRRTTRRAPAGGRLDPDERGGRARGEAPRPLRVGVARGRGARRARPRGPSVADARRAATPFRRPAGPRVGGGPGAPRRGRPAPPRVVW